MQITRSGIDTQKGPSDWFTGDVYIDAVAAPAGTSTFAAALVHFTPGVARAGRRDLEPAHLLVLAEADVAAHLEAELLRVERQRGVLVATVNIATPMSETVVRVCVESVIPQDLHLRWNSSRVSRT
jgi:hypothetical protein